VEYEISEESKVVVHFGWPMSSWLDRIAIGVMVYSLMKLPLMFPDFDFDIQYSKSFSLNKEKLPETKG